MLDNELRVDDEGYYTLVVTDEGHVPANLEAESATWIDAGPFLENRQVSYPGGGMERIEYSLSPSTPSEKWFVRIRAEILSP